MPSIDISLYPETVEAFDGNEQRATVFLDRYSRKNEAGRPVESTPQEMWARVAGAIGGDDDQREDFYDILEDFKFVPGGRILAGAGAESEVTFYNCYVIPIETRARRNSRDTVSFLSGHIEGDPGSDSREAIFDTIGLMVDIMSRGGGVGINWSVLRPKGAHLKRVNGTTSGPCSWMDVASRAVGVVEQGGSRRGAAMFMLDDWHPDLMEFINAKRDYKLITNANVSVAVSDEFMAAVREDSDWVFEFPDTGDVRYNTEWDGDLAGWKARGGQTVAYGSQPARNVWRRLAEAAWASGEPGVVFLGRYNALSTGQWVERIISVNPCGEQGLGAYSVCNLGAMNLAAYVAHGEFDWLDFSEDVETATTFLDRVVDANYYFLPQNEAIQKRLRRVGLGVMGLADALILLDLRYGSPEAIQFTEAVFGTMKHHAIAASAELARHLGAAPAWEFDWMNRPYLADLDDGLRTEVVINGLRNIFLLTQAPTGTTSILAGVNSGIEPYFAFEYTRKDRTGTHKVYAPIFGKIGPVDPGALPDFMVTSNDVTVEEHVLMQAAAQKYIDSSVSKTINGPTSQTVEDVEKAYTLAYESGCKGVAYFRDGSGRDQVLYKDEPKPADDLATANAALNALLDEAHQTLAEILPLVVDEPREETLKGVTRKVKTTAGTAYVTVNYGSNGKPVEVFVNVGKAGSDIMELGEAIGRLASLALRKGATLGGVANQLEGIGGNGKFNKPLAHAIGSALTEINLDAPFVTKTTTYQSLDLNGSVTHADVTVGGNAEIDPADTNWTYTNDGPTGDLCPDCNNFSVALQEGCKKCGLCGWSAC